MDREQLTLEYKPELAGDKAVELALDDLRDALRLAGGGRLVLRLQEEAGDDAAAVPAESYALTIEMPAAESVVADGAAADRRGLCYGIFELGRRIRL